MILGMLLYWIIVGFLMASGYIQASPIWWKFWNPQSGGVGGMIAGSLAILILYSVAQ